MLYFDHNASSLLLPRARQVWLEASTEFFGNPSSPHRVGAKADRALTDARERLAAILHCDPVEVIWTSGATESNNTVFHHFSRVLPADSEIWVSAVEHPSVLQASLRYFQGRRLLIPTSSSGVVELDWITDRLRKARPGLMAVMAANNETGVLQPWSELQRLCQQYEIPSFCDAVQWIGKLPSAGLGACDFISGSAHKFGGPKGAGFLTSRTRLQPLIVGGPQEDGRRAGTENVPGILAMVAALEEREASLKNGEHTVRLQIKNDFEARVSSLLPELKVLGQNSPRLWNTVSAVMPVTQCAARWVVKLDKAGCAVSTGSACSSGQEKPSHVILAMGFTEDQSSRVLRFSSGWETSQADWEKLANALATVYEELSRGIQLV